ncbi:DUF2207 domain-containing protein [Candidatus Saccharibacteria bacterium]|nr:DUF2207 domain-containing protein [Candidatus Saccharibacteria bacterium]
MKKRGLSLYYIMFTLICPFLLGSGRVDASVQDFHFNMFYGDYYLWKGADGVSHLKVSELLTAEFPDYNQNKGICRQIPFTNQNGANVTLPHLNNHSDLSVKRNGVEEPIYSIKREGNYYNVCTGTEEYLTGVQNYSFEYEFEKVVTDFGDYQELYWDTNGNGWQQSFDEAMVRLRFEDPEVWTGKSWCYVGRYGESGQERCKIEDDGRMVTFKTGKLKPGENLTFDVELKPGSFVVPEPAKNYAYVWTIIGLVAICALILALLVRKLLKTREKRRYYKGMFVKPEYQSNKGYSLPEMTEIFIGEKKDMKVAMLLELVVKHKIKFQKGEKKKKWNIIVEDIDGLDKEYLDLLAILNGGEQVSAGDKVELKNRTATSRLIALKKSMEDKVLNDLKRDKLVEKQYRIGGSEPKGAIDLIVTVACLVAGGAVFGLMIMQWLDGALDYSGNYGGELVFAEYFYPTALAIIAVTAITGVILSNEAAKCEKHTNLGLEMSRYMDGLKLYIGMAEAERMKALQSVKGADTSAEGVVKLYEKLLPYAAVFGLEESWMDEMKEYCKLQEIEEPDYLMRGMTAYEISRSMRMASDIARTSTVMASSGGGASSGFSGGGGGGFSGGGGGGGGGGGR